MCRAGETQAGFVLPEGFCTVMQAGGAVSGCSGLEVMVLLSLEAFDRCGGQERWLGVICQ